MVCKKSPSGFMIDGISLIEYAKELESEISQSPVTVVVIT